ncbi:DNA adenine methylase [Citrobacter amalonaticus]|uniref:DNA adenine methylase n=1 Tax=Citrobacter amalonaticus TaxID=35703 RepID=UPI0011AF529C|nr:DNA adenine methylase [Citrobacter amalonaticus]
MNALLSSLPSHRRGIFAGLCCAVYCDPVYLALSDSASFTTYDGTAFTAEHHRVLATRLRDINRMTDFPAVVSASDTPESCRRVTGSLLWCRGSLHRTPVPGD